MFVEIGLFMVSFLFLYLYLFSYYSYWNRLGVPFIKPKYPFFGNNVDTLFSLRPSQDVQTEIYNQFPKERFVGVYHFTKPKLIIRDPELVEALTTRDFPFAADRPLRGNPRANEVSMHLMNTKDEMWSNLRSKLSPMFSSTKLKLVYDLMSDCADHLVQHLSIFENDPHFDGSEAATRFTMDIVVTCAFGLKTDVLDEPESPFRALGKAAFDNGSLRKILLGVKSGLGKIGRFLPVPGGLTKEMIHFFVETIDDTLNFRKRRGIVRQDFLQLMDDLVQRERELIRRGLVDPNDPNLFDHTALISNAFVFFIAGFETTALTISFAMHELAANELVQKILYREIADLSNKHGNRLTYDVIMQMKYLDQVVLETLRMHPTIPAISRVLTKDYVIPGTDLELTSGSLVTIPIFALQHDPQYFPDPHRFLPERFSGENGPIVKGTYLPFGSGPKICIGIKFAKLVVKVALVKMLSRYKFIQCDKTVDPIRYDKTATLTAPEGGVWLRLEPRTKGSF